MGLRKGAKKPSTAFHLPWPSWLSYIPIHSEALGTQRIRKAVLLHGRVVGGIMTVRFTYRSQKIRTIGAGYWRKVKKIYERETVRYNRVIQAVPPNQRLKGRTDQMGNN
jgi:hypothetical protein